MPLFLESYCERRFKCYYNILHKYTYVPVIIWASKVGDLAVIIMPWKNSGFDAFLIYSHWTFGPGCTEGWCICWALCSVWGSSPGRFLRSGSLRRRGSASMSPEGQLSPGTDNPDCAWSRHSSHSGWRIALGPGYCCCWLSWIFSIWRIWLEHRCLVYLEVLT